MTIDNANAGSAPRNGPPPTRRSSIASATAGHTDNETWAGDIHPCAARREYREKTGTPAKLVVVAMTATGFTIAGPDAAGTLDIVGFDVAAPQISADFVGESAPAPPEPQSRKRNKCVRTRPPKPPANGKHTHRRSAIIGPPHRSPHPVMTTIAARTPIATFQDILDAMAQQPELKTELRRHLQDEDFRNLPQVMANLADSLRDLTAVVRDISLRQERAETDIVDLKAGQARLESGQARLEAGQAQHSADIVDLKAGQARLEAGQARLEAGQAQHSADIADLKAGQARLEAGQAQHSADIADLKAGQAQHSADIADLKAGQAEIVEKQTSMQGQLNRLTGTDYERKIARNLRRRAYRHFGINDAELTHSVTLPNSSRIPDLLDAACDQGIITDDEVNQAQVIDIVISGVTDANQPAYVAIEASVTVGYSDISRARERAAIISRAAGVPVIAGVVGTEIPDAVRQNAADHGVTVVIMPD